MKLTKKIYKEVAGKAEKDPDATMYILCFRCGRAIYIGEKIMVMGYHLGGKYYGHPCRKCYQYVGISPDLEMGWEGKDVEEAKNELEALGCLQLLFCTHRKPQNSASAEGGQQGGKEGRGEDK